MVQPTPTRFRALIAPSLMLALLMTLNACSKLDQPVDGSYRAHVTLRGGDVPVQMQLSHDDQGLSLTWQGVNQATLAATHVQVRNGELTADLPEQLGTLQARFTAKQLTGEIRLTDSKGQPITLPFAADLGQSWRFVEQPSSDNADISGDWQLEAISTEHFNAPVTVHLTQNFDQVDGQLQLPDGQLLPVVGQVHGDELDLGGIGYSRALLLKGKVNEHGELQGDAWLNLSSAHPWVARRIDTDESANGVKRTVALPWAVPTRPATVTD